MAGDGNSREGQKEGGGSLSESDGGTRRPKEAETFLPLSRCLLQKTAVGRTGGDPVQGESEAASREI